MFRGRVKINLCDRVGGDGRYVKGVRVHKRDSALELGNSRGSLISSLETKPGKVPQNEDNRHCYALNGGAPIMNSFVETLTHKLMGFRSGTLGEVIKHNNGVLRNGINTLKKGSQKTTCHFLRERTWGNSIICQAGNEPSPDEDSRSTLTSGLPNFQND